MEKVQSSKDKQLACDINKLCLNLHSHLVNLPDEIASSVNRIYVSSLLHPIFNLFIKYDFDESIINSFNNEYLKSYPSFKIHNNVLWDIYQVFRRFSSIPSDGTNDLICKICKVSVSTTELSLFNHINICKLSKNHDIFMERVVSDFELHNRNCTIGYYCDFCKVHFNSTQTKIFSLNSAKSLHSKACKGLQDDKREITWVHCDVCSVDLCGHNVLELHKESIGHKIVELNLNSHNSMDEHNVIDFKTAEYNFMVKYIHDITEAVPSSFGLQDVRSETIFSTPLGDKVNVNTTSDDKKKLELDCISNSNGSTYKNFMLEVVKKTIQNKMKDIYNGYFCEFCQNWTFSEDKFYSHINSSDHNDKISQQCVQINSCLTCMLFIIGSDKSIDLHIKSEEHLTLKYLSELDGREKNDLNASAVNLKSNESGSNDEENYFSDSGDSDDNYCQQNKSVSFPHRKPRKSGSNPRKSISVSKESITSTSSNCNKKSRPKKIKSRKTEISGSNSNLKAMRKTLIKVSEFPLTTTRTDIFNAFKGYGHIDEIRFGKNNVVAYVSYKLKSVADLLTDNNVPIYIKGTKVKIEKNVKSVWPSSNENKRLPATLEENYKSLLNFKTMISDISIEAISEESSLEKNGKIILKNELENIFKKEVKIIGSFSCGLALSTSTFDVYVDVDDYYIGKTYNALSFAELAGELKYILKNNYQDKFTDISFTIKGNPILSLTNKDKHLCNIFFSNGLADQKTELIKTYLKIDARVKPTILLVKKWMTLTNILDSDNLTGYAITWMVFFYLMSIRKPVLPPVVTLRNQVDGGFFIGGWDCRFTKDVSKLPRSENRQSVEELVYGFFKFCTDGNLLKCVCCPLTGEFIKKKNMTNLDLPSPYDIYKCNLIRKTIEDRFPTTGALCLQDPIELNCNLTIKLKDSLFNNFKWMCLETMKLCKPWVLKLNSDC